MPRFNPFPLFPALHTRVLPPAPHAPADPPSWDSSLMSPHAPSWLQVGAQAYQHHYVPCNASTVGSFAACHNGGIKASNNNDFPFMASPVSLAQKCVGGKCVVGVSCSSCKAARETVLTRCGSKLQSACCSAPVL